MELLTHLEFTDLRALSRLNNAQTKYFVASIWFNTLQYSNSHVFLDVYQFSFLSGFMECYGILWQFMDEYTHILLSNSLDSFADSSLE